MTWVDPGVFLLLPGWPTCPALKPPGAKDTPNRATQDGSVSGRCAATELFRLVASKTRPARERSVTAGAVGVEGGLQTTLTLTANA